MKMKWPFPTGISSPAISEKSDDDVLSHFESNLKLLLKLNSQYPLAPYEEHSLDQSI